MNSNNEKIEQTVKKIYQCPICKKSHEIKFPKNFADNRTRYPFSYVFLHKYENSERFEDKDKDILTTLYIDAHLNIRGIEALLTEDDTNILSKETSKEIIGKLSRFILELTETNEEMVTKFNELQKKYQELLNK